MSRELVDAWVSAMNDKYHHRSHWKSPVGISHDGIRRIREVVGDFCIGKNTAAVFRKYVEIGDATHEDVVAYAKSFVAIADQYEVG